MSFQIKGIQEQRANLVNELSKIAEKAETENRSLNAEEKKAFDAVKENIATCDYRLNTLRDIEGFQSIEKKAEKRNVRPSLDNGKNEIADEKSNGSVADYLRSAQIGEQFNYANETPNLDFRTVTKSTNVVGPQDFWSSIVATAASYAGVLNTGAEVQITSQGGDLPIFVAADASVSGELIGEDTAAASGDISYSIKTLKAYKMGSKEIVISEEMIEDAGFNVEAFVAAAAGERIGRITNTYFTTGTGSSQPQGIVVGATTGKTAASTTTFTYAELLDLYHSVDPAYRNDESFRFMFNDTVCSFLRKMVDGAGRYIWEPGRVGEPDTILGKKYVVNNAMDSAFTTGKKLVVCGAMNRYKVRMVRSINLKRSNELYMKSGNVVFYATLRLDGLVADTTAIKKLVLA